MTNKQLKDLRMILKSGGYDDAHIMQAGTAIDELVKTREAILDHKNGISEEDATEEDRILWGRIGV